MASWRLYAQSIALTDLRFKLHLRPPSILPGAALPPININLSAVEILADYFRYVFRCAKSYISETNPIGRQILNSGTPIDFVLSHPNGWTGFQQSSMRRAAILAQLVSDDDEGTSRLQFVTEGEASLQFCIATGMGDEVIQASPDSCWHGLAEDSDVRPRKIST